MVDVYDVYVRIAAMQTRTAGPVVVAHDSINHYELDRFQIEIVL